MDVVKNELYKSYVTDCTSFESYSRSFVISERRIFMTEKTLTEYYEKIWLPVKKSSLKLSSYTRLEQIVYVNIIPALGDEILQSITPMTIIKFMQIVAEKYSFSTAKKIYQTLNSCFKYAIQTNDITINPMTIIPVPQKNKYPPAQKMSVLTVKEISIMKKTITEKSGKSKIDYIAGWAFYIMLNTGLRPGELLALTWADIQGDYIYINKNIVTVKDSEINKYITIVQQTPKTASSERRIFMNNNVRLALKEIRSFYFPVEKYIISFNGSFITPNHFRKLWYRFIKYSGIKKRNLYSLRHTFASLMFSQGCDIKSISYIMGHSSVRTTYDTYIHLFEKNYRETNVLDRII